MNAQGWREGIKGKLRRWAEVYRGRRELRQLSDHMLKDIGLSRADAEGEAARPFWDDRVRADITLKRNRLPAQTDCTGAPCPARP